jgi:hypothetical protein
MRCWLPVVLAYLVTEQMVKLCGTLFSAKSSLSVLNPRRKGMSFGDPRSRPFCTAMLPLLLVAKSVTAAVFEFLLLPLTSDNTCVCAFQFAESAL